MPLVFERDLRPKGKIGIWKIEEPESFFTDNLLLYPDEFEHFEKIKGRKRIEWLAVRYLLHLLSERDTRGMVLKDKHGKPHLNDSPWNISISHTLDYAAVIASPDPVGIDIQTIVSRIQLIADKFLNESEKEIVRQSADPVMTLHIIWGIKESLYKIHGTGALDFRKHLHVSPFTAIAAGGLVDCSIENGHSSHTYTARYELIHNNMLVYAQIKTS